jgi:general secretion pathway protein A
MYREYFGLKESPFSIAPDPGYLYMSDGHREALAHLVYGMTSDSGFVLLTGEVGTGKTTVCRCLLERIPVNSDVAFVLNPKVTAQELLATVCDEFGIHYPEGNTSIKVFVDNINAFLLDAHAKGRKTVLIIEEAQNLGLDVLEQVRLLTNLETNQRKLLQIIMVGQPELQEMLSRSELRQLAQRITARYHLGPLSKKEVGAYVKHRLTVAGLMRGKLFPARTIARLFRLSGGIPRLINVICDRALLGAYVQGKERVDTSTLLDAAHEAFGETRKQRKIFKWLSASVMLLACAFLFTSNSANQRSKIAAITTLASRPRNNIRELEAESRPMATLLRPLERPGPSSEETAYQKLLDRWHITYLAYRPQGGRTVCDEAQMQGLYCLHKKGDLSSLRSMNRPAVVKLFDDQGAEFSAALITLGERSATVTMGDEPRVVDVKEVVRRWAGDYVLFWRVPPEYKGDIKRGSRGPFVRWLDTQLSLVQGRTARGRKDLAYDDVMIKHVKEFQLGEGLAPNGAIGPETIIHLHTAVGSDEPLLHDGKEAR